MPQRAAARSRPRGVPWLVGLAAAAAVAALLAWIWPRLEARLGRRPEPIVLVSIDTLRADHLPAYGYRRVATPALDALAADGIVFERAYAHSPQTLPSHVSIFSGRLPFEHGVRDNIGFTVKRDERLLAERLREAGYRSGGFVSAYVLRQETGIGRGFDRYDSRLPVSSPELSFGQVQRDGAQTLERATAWLDEQPDARVFLFVHFYEPHTPYSPPPRFARYDPYDGEIAYADELVGRLVAVLRAKNLYDRSLIVVLSDHGEGLGDHGELEHGVFLYNETVHVPLIVKMPGARGAGRRVSAVVQHIDLVPTLLDLVGLPVPPELRGRSLVPVLRGRRADTVPESGVYAEALYPRYHFGWSELYSLTDGRYRYIRAPRPELYDLHEDPGEQHNLAAARASTSAAMRGALDRLLAGRAIDTPARASSEERERLQALGYVGTEANVAPATSGETLPDPKDKIATLRAYREALELASARRFAEAGAAFRKILAENPAMKDVWHQLANVSLRAGATEDALAAYRHLIALDPSDPLALLGAAGVYLKRRQLDEATRHAEAAAEAAAPDDRRTRANAYELLMKIALRRRDRDAARQYAAKAQETDPTLPLSVYVQGRLAHLEGRYAEALGYFQEAARRLEGRTMTLTELHFYLGDTLGRLGRNAEAEREFLAEIRLFPQETQARAGLAMLYWAAGRDRDTARVIDDLVQAVPTREGYDLGIRLWTTFGQPEQARALAARARRALGRPTAGDAR
jgi:choline-sulfatase